MITLTKQFTLTIHTTHSTYTQVCNGARSLDMATAAAIRNGHTLGSVSSRPYRAL